MNLFQAPAPITYHPASVPAGARFSVLIPTWNNLPYLKLCVNSLLRNSAFAHQIVLHINGNEDGTRQWADSQQIAYSFSPRNVGICWAMNAASSLANTDYIAFLNDDMVALPGWDSALWAVIEKITHPNWFLSGTLVEPTDTGNKCALAPFDFGRTIETFREAELLSALESVAKADWAGATWPPNVLPRRLWELVGGYSTEFGPGMYSDPDFSAKLWQAGVRHFQGVGDSRVYHFQARSTGRVRKNDGKRQFLRKWEMSSSTFTRHYLKRGEPWNGPLSTVQVPTLIELKDRLKRMFI